jgi:hypothetical protein
MTIRGSLDIYKETMPNHKKYTDEQNRWKGVRGFNYQPSYGRNANEIWIDLFDRDVIAKELTNAKRFFPYMNSVRLWLSHEPFMKSPVQFVENLEKVLCICHRLGLQAIPVLYNNWHSIPDFGGVSTEMIRYWFNTYGKKGTAPDYVFQHYMKEVFGRYSGDKRILAWDMCNEPFNSGQPEEYKEWLQHIYRTGKSLGVVQPIGVSVQSHLKMLSDVEPVSDVLMIHPYFASKLPWDELLNFAKNAGKTFLATECCWGSLSDPYRVDIVISDLNTLTSHNIGFLPHALQESLVADLHRPHLHPLGISSSASYMAFINIGGTLRPGHSVYNLYCPEYLKQYPSDMDEAVRYLEAKSFQMIRLSRRKADNGTYVFLPQVGQHYNAFWLRDYSYMLEGNPDALTDDEVVAAYRFFLSGQREDGACVDCIKLDGSPVYQPGYGTMGINPVSDGSQFMINVAWHTWKKTGDLPLIKETIDKLFLAMQAVQTNAENGLVHIKTTKEWERAPYGFTDTVRKTGDIFFCSLLYVQACRQLSEMAGRIGLQKEASYWKSTGEKTAEAIRSVFWDSGTGLFLAATGDCRQPDIWGSAFAVYLGVSDREQENLVAGYFKKHYTEIVKRGQVRHLPAGMYWEFVSEPDGLIHKGDEHNTECYQNGAYWATPVGWFVYALHKTAPALAERTVTDMVGDFIRTGDVNECINDNYANISEYVVSASLPLAGIRRIINERRQ